MWKMSQKIEYSDGVSFKSEMMCRLPSKVFIAIFVSAVARIDVRNDTEICIFSLEWIQTGTRICVCASMSVSGDMSEMNDL